jgi:hypothetical protein
MVCLARLRLAVAGAGFLAAAWLLRPSVAAGELSDVPRAQHGAASMEHQLRLLAKTAPEVDVARGFTDQRPVSEGIGEQLGKRNAPTTLNVALLQTLFWDGPPC